MRIIALILIFLAFLSLCFLFSEAAETNDKTLIALLVVREDLIENCINEEILLIGEYSQGKYGVVSYWDEKIKDMVSRRKELLEAHKKFTVFRRGTAIKEITTKKMCTAAFDCDEIIVGSGASKSLVNNLEDFKSNLITIASGFSYSKEFSYKTTYYVAINTDSPAINSQQYSIPTHDVISETNKKAIYEYAREELLKKNELIKAQDIKLSTLLAYDLNRDKIKDYIVVAKAENDKTKESGIFVVNIMEKKVVPILAKDLTNRPSSWGNGYELLDVIDLDGDKKPEIIFEVKGYESTGYEIYQFINNRLIEVFDDVIYGC